MGALLMAIGRMHQHRAMSGRAPETMATGHLKHAPGASPHFPYRYPHRANLSPRQADVLELIRVKPRDLREASEALGIGEWSIVAQVLHQLVNRGLATEVHGYPTTWEAI